MPVSAVTPLTILHTSDWHLGRRLYGRLRYDEFEAFLSWLQDTISEQQVDVLIVAGDIFDTMTPSNKAQALYYEFLGTVSKSCCQHVIIVAGNHDSPTFLDAPSNILKFLNVHVIGTACEDLNDEVMVLDDTDGNPHCIIAAVPYLRDRDVRSSSAGESRQTKDANVIAGICAHYDNVADIAKTKQAELAKAHKRHIPIIATGHLFALDSKTTEDDGVRDLYVGNLGQISASMFDSCFDYVALGHLHVPQRVGSCDHIRYSGSPIAMGFGEARQQKQVLLVQFGAAVNSLNNENFIPEVINDISLVPTSKPAPIEKEASHSMNNTQLMDDLFAFDESVDDNTTNKINESDKNKDSQHPANSDAQEPFFKQGLSATVLPALKLLHHDASRNLQVISLAIPCFQKLAQVSGDWEQINTELTTLMKNTKSVWLEVIYTGKKMMTDLRKRIDDLVTESNNDIEVLKIRNMQIKDKVMMQNSYSQEALQDLSNAEVFERCLSSHDIVDEQKPALRNAYQEIVQMIVQEDLNAE